MQMADSQYKMSVPECTIFMDGCLAFLGITNSKMAPSRFRQVSFSRIVFGLASSFLFLFSFLYYLGIYNEDFILFLYQYGMGI